MEMKIDWDGFDIPEQRKDVSNIAHASWVLRNLGIQNSEHPKLKDTLDLVKKIKREQMMAKENENGQA